MPRFGPQLVFTTVALIGALMGGTQPVQAGKESDEKGAKIYCFMRSSGNDHSVSWNAAYAVIKRQGGQLFKTCLLYTSPSPRDRQKSHMPSAA